MDCDKTLLRPIIEKVKLIYGKSLLTLIDIFEENEYDIKIAGASVRDLLMNKMPKVLCLVTTATPSHMKEMFANSKVSLANSDVQKYGIVTPRIANQSYDIATIPSRTTDYIHPDDATVKFTSKWEIDAYGRVFTVNSMFLGFDGTIIDCFDGFADMIKLQVRIIGDPAKRINEDCMRILEYFRLFGLIAKNSDNHDHDQEILNAIKANITKLEKIKGKEIWANMKGILSQNMRGQVMETFLECGGATCLGLPKNLNYDEFREITRENNFRKHPLLGISYLSALLTTPQEVTNLHRRLGLSVYERDLAIFLIQNRAKTRDIDDLVYYKQMCLLPVGGANKQICKEYVLELLKYNNKKYLFKKLLLWEQPLFPIDRYLLESNGCRKGTAVEVLNKLKDARCRVNFQMSSDDLFEELTMVLQQRNDRELKKRALSESNIYLPNKINKKK